MSARASIREAVVRTSDLPLVGDVYRAIHRVARRAFLARLREVPGATRLEVAPPRAIVPGITDVDLFYVLRGEPRAGEARQRARTVMENVELARRGLPLAVDVRLFTERELALGFALGDGYLASMRAEIAPFVAAHAITPRRDTSLGALQRRTYHTLRAARHAIEGHRAVDRALVAHALAKSGQTGAPARSAVEDVVRALAELDAHVATDAPPLDVPAAGAHGGVTRARASLEAWSEPLRGHAALASFALVPDSYAPLDVRLVLVVDPAHPRSPEALRAVRAHVARWGTPRLRRDLAPLRPHLLTPALLTHPASHRIPSLEPALRRAAFVVGAPLPAARLAREDLVRNLVLGLLFTSSELRERAHEPPSERELLRAHAALHGVLPAARQLLVGDTLAPCTEDDTLTPGLRVDASEALHAAVYDLLPALVGRG